MTHCHASKSRYASYSIQASQGFSLVEVLTAVAILGVLMGLAAPSFSEISLSSRLTDTANSLVSSAAQGRSEAIKRNAVVTMCMSADSSTCATSGGWQQGWILRAPVVPATSPPTFVILYKDAGPPAGFKVNGSVNSIDFNPVGVGTTQATLTVCRNLPTVASQERIVSVSATGKAATTKTTTGTCP